MNSWISGKLSCIQGDIRRRKGGKREVVSMIMSIIIRNNVRMNACRAGCARGAMRNVLDAGMGMRLMSSMRMELEIVWLKGRLQYLLYCKTQLMKTMK